MNAESVNRSSSYATSTRDPSNSSSKEVDLFQKTITGSNLLELQSSSKGTYTSPDPRSIAATIRSLIAKQEKDLQQACRTGNIVEVQRFLNLGPILETTRGALLTMALKHNHPKVALVFLADGSISQEARGEALILTCEKEYLDIVTELLEEKHPILQEDLASALNIVSKKSNLRLLEELLKFCKFSEKARGSAVIIASDNADLETALMLLADGNISEEDRGRALIKAAENGHIGLIEYLRAHGPISGNYLALATSRALEKNYLQTVEALSTNGIPNTSRITLVDQSRP